MLCVNLNNVKYQMLKIFVKIIAILFIIIALFSYWANPIIFVVGLLSFIVAFSIRKKRFYLILLLLFILLAIILILYTPMMYHSFFLEYYEVKYMAFGKYSNITKEIELQERVGLQKLQNETDKELLKEYITNTVLKDSTFLTKDLYSTLSSERFYNWLKSKGWKVEIIPKDSDQNIFLWITRNRTISINEKWYRPFTKNTILLPRIPFNNVSIRPIQGSEIIIDMPVGMVHTTSPPNASKLKSIGYERIKIPLEIFDKSIELKLLSWPWRSNIFYLIAKYIFWNPLMWFIGIITAIFADKIKLILSSRFCEPTSQKQSSSSDSKVNNLDEEI